MKRRKYIILISCIGCLSLFTIHIVTAEEELSGLTLANIEALSIDENTFLPCNTANGYCVTGGFPIQGIHFEKD